MSAREILGLVMVLSPFIFLFWYTGRYVLGWKNTLKGFAIALLITGFMHFGVYLLRTAP